MTLWVFFPFAEDLITLARPASGRNRAVILASRLAALEAGGTTDIPRAVARLFRIAVAPGLGGACE